MPAHPENIFDAVARDHGKQADDGFYYPVVSGALAGLFISALDAADMARKAIIDGNRELALLHLDSIIASDPRGKNK